MNRKNLVNNATQVLLPALTLSAQFAVAAGNPKWGLGINMVAQPFWIFSAWRAYKNAGQVGIFITTLIFTVITAWGILNYWF